MADPATDYKRAAVIIVVDGRFLWDIGYPKGITWRVIRGRKHVAYTDVGGSVKPGESFEEAAIRECKEETGCDVELVPSPKSFIINDVGGDVQISETRGERALVISRKMVLGGKMLASYNYLGRIDGIPRPQREVPALLYTPVQELFRRRTPTVDQIISDGSVLIEQVRIPHSALIRPWALLATCVSYRSDDSLTFPSFRKAGLAETGRSRSSR